MFKTQLFIFGLLQAVTMNGFAMDATETLEATLSFYQKIEKTWTAINGFEEESESIWFRVEGATVVVGQHRCWIDECETTEVSSELKIRNGKLYQDMENGTTYLVTNVTTYHLELTDIDNTDLEKRSFDRYHRHDIIQYNLDYHLGDELHRRTNWGDGKGSSSTSNRHYFPDSES